MRLSCQAESQVGLDCSRSSSLRPQAQHPFQRGGILTFHRQAWARMPPFMGSRSQKVPPLGALPLGREVGLGVQSGHPSAGGARPASNGTAGGRDKDPGAPACICRDRGAPTHLVSLRACGSSRALAERRLGLRGRSGRPGSGPSPGATPECPRTPGHRTPWGTLSV